MTIPAQIIGCLLFLGGRCRLPKTVFPLATVKFLMLYVRRLLGFFRCSIGKHSVKHRVDGPTVVLPKYKVLAECRSAHRLV